MSKDNDSNSGRRNANSDLIKKFATNYETNKRNEADEKMKNSGGYGIPKPLEKEKTVTANDIKETATTVGLTVAKLVPAFSNPITATIATGAVVSAAIKNTMETKELRELYQEKKALDEQKACNSIQGDLTKQHPELGKLKAFQPVKEQKSTEMLKKNYKCMNEQHPTVTKDQIVKNISKEIVIDKATEKAVDAIKEHLVDIVESPDPASIAIKLGIKATNAIKDIGEIKEAYDKALEQNSAKEDINKTKKSLLDSNIRPYGSHEELLENARQKKIETAAAIAITENKEQFNKIKDDPKALEAAFEKAKEKASKTIKEVSKDNKVVEFAKDFARSIKAGGSKYSGDLEFTKPKELEEKFKNQGFASEKTSGERFKQSIKDVISPEYKPKESKYAEQYLKAINMLDKSQRNNDIEEKIKRDVSKIRDNIEHKQPSVEHNKSGPVNTPKVTNKSLDKGNQR